MDITNPERFFHAAAELNVGKQNLKRYSDFVNHKIYDLLLRGEATAKANDRDIIDPQDLPITKGLQERIHAFTKLGGEIELKSILDHITARPPLDQALRDVTEAKLAEIAGGLSVALARGGRGTRRQPRCPTRPGCLRPRRRHPRYASGPPMRSIASARIIVGIAVTLPPLRRYARRLRGRRFRPPRAPVQTSPSPPRRVRSC
jgi:hypothetical protein